MRAQSGEHARVEEDRQPVVVHRTKLPDRAKQWESLNPQVATVDATGRLTAIAESESAWSPDGTKIGYAGSPSYGGDQDIYVVNVDGSNFVNLTPGTPLSIDLSAAWSPDEKTIA